jgi:Glycosyl transferase family 11
MLAAQLNGGLGNQLFQLAFAETLSRETGRTLCMLNHDSPNTGHSKTQYFQSIFSDFTTCPLLPSQYSRFKETSAQRVHSLPPLTDAPNLYAEGYFQNWEYVSPSFIERLRLPSCPSTDTAFLHIRGGDYVNHSFHDVGLGKYYEKAIKLFPSDTLFHVFTNDIEYAKSMEFLKDLPHCFIMADEVTSLAMMSRCSRGGICANSSFSWWGAFLNPNRLIVMPDTWFNDPSLYIKGYYFPGVIKVAII